MYLGAHLGISGGFASAVAEATKLGAECLQVFAKSPQMWAGPPVTEEAAAAFRSAVRGSGLRATAVHHGYLLNLASPKPEMLERSRAAFRDEIGRADRLGVDALIFHPGAHLGSGTEAGIATLCASLDGALEATVDSPTRLLLENAAGQGSALCSTLEELGEVLARVRLSRRLGVTLDTCHLFAAGFDLRSEDGYGSLVDRVRATIGAENVLAFHLNDAKAGVGSHLDRHENIGRGEIGEAGFARLVRDPRWARVPGYLETPLDDHGYARYAEDLATLRRLGGSGGPPGRPRRAAGARRGSSRGPSRPSRGRAP
ncbi:MAG TPA: deoxyribonuclease IV [Thermoplasmata archaeon]|nr:deoxyribonuclease IV [Thermoplasmata archaeon]